MGRLILVSCFLIVAFVAIVALFWQQELKYQLPTPVPVQYKAVATGTSINRNVLPAGSAYFLHFYNPDCPCSSFNCLRL